MRNTDEPDLLTPMDEEERENLQNKLNDQRLKLEENKKYLEQLRSESENGLLTTTNRRHSQGGDHPDPDSMLKSFLESIEREELSMDALQEQVDGGNEEMSHMENNERHHLVSNNIAKENFYGNPSANPTGNPSVNPSANPLDEYNEQKNFLFLKKNSGKNFSFKIGKVPTEEKVIHIEKKVVNHFDKSIQVNLITDESTSPLQHSRNGKKRRERLVSLVSNSQPNEGDLKSEKSGTTKFGRKKDAVLKKGVGLGGISSDGAPPQGKEPNQADILLQSRGFLSFLERTSKIVERSLGEQDVLNATFDFAAKDITGGDTESAERMKFVNTYSCKKYTNGRPITDVRTSNIYSELFLASYGLSTTSNYTDPDGYVLVWNSTMNGRPEYVFTSETAVCTSVFNKFNPHLIIGGTYTGNVLLWDIRASQKAIQRTHLTPQGHLHPIYCAEVIGTLNAHNLVTADTDGRLCNWSLNMLTYPSDTIDLKRTNKEVSCCCFSFQEGEINTLYGGADDGTLFQAQIHGTKVGITEFYNIHHGPLTAAQFHPLIDGIPDDHNDLILTCSVDWSCKMLSVKEPHNALYTFDCFDDYLMDVKWNPVHPAIFATCSSNGNIKVWNMCLDLDCPYFDMTVQAKSTNKIAWSCDGKKLIAADSDGALTLWNASSEVYQPRSEDIAKYSARVEKMRSERTGVAVQ
ncbi:cytoplasmic dynein intermediate chain, putative [Plasmodium knowlesi strain H]|uniref:Cytoplasmic dynein intermediate chain, putative n=3 Tax=Plasmodium knowlesi TaxID=5850 RepID=A0A5K1UR39_PLAKH|nr:cytoplasmic dynein intermediate chain, putative [Plasmodium knowlesi strain H]OTN68249.1 putative Cytoplasmic dynein inoermediate chain [Plasmodium knowlesi]CAA9987095.1 cytoplasmic dynein intermediate chain, putative [Plasmodium knowlesi strain H]SBO23830.1 cytoplasmic dynein intermediate chain, putative [Plasmodium knowlesi strain H]SBO25609.1 cytoplasmic dynein intermediate chain, putative [Plasmodium knowlesi strain H]VVS76569.1 cytoplasmic dynein intermediate chain, putative [Plasmodiu|eukprot:XP_002261717.1 cytoplasmic dynein inoermediate chain, putative [Plasmodium knowlesi strain H]